MFSYYLSGLIGLKLPLIVYFTLSVNISHMIHLNASALISGWKIEWLWISWSLLLSTEWKLPKRWNAMIYLTLNHTEQKRPFLWRHSRWGNGSGSQRLENTSGYLSLLRVWILNKSEFNCIKIKPVNQDEGWKTQIFISFLSMQWKDGSRNMFYTKILKVRITTF